MIRTFTSCRALHILLTVFLGLHCNNGFGQDTLAVKQTKVEKSYKSYHSYKAPLIEDNSFFVEEAFNQGAGVIQFISTCYVENTTAQNIGYSFTQEIPLKGETHQFSYTINYFSSQFEQNTSHGLGDILLNYRYELWGKDNWALITPRLSLIVPTGDFRKDFGQGAWGGQFNLPVTKMLSNKFVFHYNAGFTFLKDAKFSFSDAGSQTINGQAHLKYFNVGSSLIWMAADKLNFMVEYVSNFNEAFDNTGEIASSHQMIINPGFRYAFDMGKCQIVPGFSLPIAVENQAKQAGAFIYLSIEPDYNIKN